MSCSATPPKRVFREEDIVEAIAQDVAPWFPKGV